MGTKIPPPVHKYDVSVGVEMKGRTLLTASNYEHIGMFYYLLQM